MEFGLKNNTRKKMGFDHFPQNVFSTKERINIFSPTINVGAPMDNSEIEWSKTLDLKVPSTKKAEEYTKKMPFNDRISLWVGGFVGSKSQAGGSNHRGSEVYRLWDVIRAFIPDIQKQDSSKEAFSQSEGIKLGGSYSKVDVKVKPKPPMSSKVMNKSYAEVAKSGKVDECLSKMTADCMESVRVTTDPIVMTELKGIRSLLPSASPRVDGVIMCQTVINCSPVEEDFCGIETHRLCMRSSSISSESDTSEPIVAPSRQPRTLSLCSNDSDDSFIVFENNEEEVASDDDYSDDDSSSDENDEVDFCSLRNVRALPECQSSTQCLKAVNSQWDESYSTSQPKVEKKSNQKRVSFAKDKDLAKVQLIVVWDFAYRSARKGPWEELARDSARFRERIRRCETAIAPVLAANHREKIYAERFAEPVNKEAVKCNPLGDVGALEYGEEALAEGVVGLGYEEVPDLVDWWEPLAGPLVHLTATVLDHLYTSSTPAPW